MQRIGFAQIAPPSVLKQNLVIIRKQITTKAEANG